MGNRKRYTAKFCYSYRCPFCNELMFINKNSIFTSVDYGYEIYTCEKCQKHFEFCFREIITKPKVSGIVIEK